MSAGGAPRAWDGSRTTEVVAAAILLGVAIAGFVAVPHFVSGWAFIMPGTTDASLAPTFFPRLAMVLLGITALGVIVSAPARREQVPLLAMERQDWIRVGSIIVLVAVYFAALKFVGFVLASAAFMAVVPLALGYRRWGVVLCVAVIAPLAIALAFRYGLKVLLPAGVLGTPF
jgi:hypothetical protein